MPIRKPRIRPLGSSAIDFSSMQSWTRHPSSPIFGGTAGNFAADPHVWEETPGTYYMVYTTDYAGTQAIGMATSSDLVHWTPISSPQYSSEYVIRGNGPSAGQNNQETAIHYKTASGQHQLYYIGYDNEATYQSQIYRATASSVTGPYTRESSPVIPFGAPGSYDDAAMTSPTIVSFAGTLYMAYVAWADSPTSPTPTVINAGATSSNDGTTWTKTGTISWSDVFGVEAHVEKGPDGLFYRVGTEVPSGADVLSLGVANNPFGPYTVAHNIYTMGGPSVGEVVSITGACLFFNRRERRLYIYYSAVDTGGFPWMTGLATTSYH